MRVVRARSAFVTEAEDGEVVGIDGEPVLGAESLEHGLDLGRRDQDRAPTTLAHQMLVVVVDRQVPAARLTSEVYVMNETDPGESMLSDWASIRPIRSAAVMNPSPFSARTRQIARRGRVSRSPAPRMARCNASSTPAVASAIVQL
jgi:hypothetical protein